MRLSYCIQRLYRLSASQDLRISDKRMKVFVGAQEGTKLDAPGNGSLAIECF